MKTLAEHWAFLEPALTVVGPDDDRPRPAVLLFHGCGGASPNLPRAYADAAAAAGWRAFLVDSYTPRGWSRAFAMATVEILQTQRVARCLNRGGARRILHALTG